MPHLQQMKKKSGLSLFKHRIPLEHRGKGHHNEGRENGGRVLVRPCCHPVSRSHTPSGAHWLVPLKQRLQCGCASRSCEAAPGHRSAGELPLDLPDRFPEIRGGGWGPDSTGKAVGMATSRVRDGWMVNQNSGEGSKSVSRLQ